jgi:hemerythrin-like domain-containing protein
MKATRARQLEQRIRRRMKVDHEDLADLFQRLREAFAADAREDTQALWGQLQRRLTAHLDAEEAVLLPRFAVEHPREARRLLAEHAQLRAQLDELGTGVDLKLVREPVARAFFDTLAAHAAREDAELYRWADEVHDEALRSALAARLTPLG